MYIPLGGWLNPFGEFLLRVRRNVSVTHVIPEVDFLRLLNLYKGEATTAMSLVVVDKRNQSSMYDNLYHSPIFLISSLFCAFPGN